MPATALTVQKTDNTDGVAPTNQAIDSANGNEFVNDGKTRVRFLGAASATGQATIVRQKKCNYGATHNVVTPANALDLAPGVGTWGEMVELGPFDESFNDANGKVQITYSGTVAGILVNVISDAAP